MQKTISSLLLVSILGVSAFAQTPTPTPTRARVAVPETADAAAKDVANTRDPVLELRDQIDAAPNASERNRLHLKLADLLLSTGHKADALAEMQLIASSTEFDPTGFYNLGNSYARLGDSDAAIAAYRTAIDQRKGRYSRAYNNLGVVLLRAGRWDDAYDALLSALKIENFRYAEASYNLGRVYSARGQQDLAAREWHRALAVDPAHDAAKLALARGGTEGRIVVASSQPPKTARDTAPPVAAKPKVVVSKGSASETPASAASAPKALVVDQTSFDYLQRARNAFERGKMTEAVDNFRRVIKLQNGYFPPATLELSYALLSLKRYDEALVNLLQVSQRDGARYPVSYFHLGRVYELRGELKLAEASFSQAVDAYGPSNGVFLLDLSRVREKLGDYKGSLEAVERYLKWMEEQGQKPTWSDERLAELRTKAAKQ